MAKITPLRLAVPRKEYIAQVASYPYDVISTEEARQIAGGNPFSFLHVTKSQIDLPSAVDQYDEQVYDAARGQLCEFLKQGVLVREKKKKFYLYCQTMGEHFQCGLVAGVSVDDFKSGLVKEHESTLKEKLIDRTRHIEITNAQTGPIFVTYGHIDAVDKFVSEELARPPVFDFTAPDGIRHSAWAIENRRGIVFLEDQFSQVNKMYIADGHHRAAAAVEVARRRSKDNPGKANELSNYVLCVLFPDSQLKIIAYNRVVADLNGMSETVFIERTKENFNVRVSPQGSSPRGLHQSGMYLGGKWYILSIKPEKLKGRNRVGSLDTSILQDFLLRPILGIEDPRTDRRIKFVGGIRGTAELERLVDTGHSAVAFCLFPTTISQVMEIADEGRIMPPKSTWFEPKLRDGIFLHLLK